MKKINIHLVDGAQRDLTSMQLFDFYYAYCQFKNKHNNYTADIDIKIGNDLKLDPTALNIGFYNMPERPVDTSKFDFVLLNANGIAIDNVTQELHCALVNDDKCYLITTTYVADTHPLRNKLIYFPYFLHNRDYVNRPFYPQFYEPRNKEKTPGKNLIFINGQNRPHRQYMMDLVDNSQVDIRMSQYGAVSELNIWGRFCESSEDTAFREFVNKNYKLENTIAPEEGYYEQSVKVGIDEQYGLVPPGYFPIDEFWDYHCIIWPETSWFNDGIFLTEKISKTSWTKCVPWPVGGANIDVLYNQLGLKTAWNLLPDQLQLYNYELDHVKRYQMCAHAIKWVSENPEILTGPAAQELLENNYNWFFSNQIETIGPQQFDRIIQEYTK